MCGIAGILAKNEALAREVLPRLLAAQTHRGPDDVGEFYAPFGASVLGLGHRRLAILDLTPSGHQPMGHPETGSQLVFNGEIYNFPELREELRARGTRFRSTGDSEVLLQALEHDGPECLTRMQGMFAFAWFDRRNQRLVLARDPLGIKPLYIAHCDAGLLFASEVRALLASGVVPREIDRVGVAGLLAYGSVQQPRTTFRAIRSLVPGSYEVITPGTPPANSGPKRFWRFPAPAGPGDTTDPIPRVRATVDQAVKSHLVSDVPIGLFLSSGIDSTVIAGIAAKYAPDFRTFTLTFQDQPEFREDQISARTAQAFGLPHKAIDVRTSDAEAAARDWLGSIDQPSLDGLNTYLVSKVVKAQGITVALSGQGGDEMFLGYSTFTDVVKLRKLHRIARILPRGLRVLTARPLAMGRSRVAHEKLRDILASRGTLLELYLQRRRSMSDQQIAALGLTAEGLGIPDTFLPPEAVEEFAWDERDEVAALSTMEANFYLGNMLLRDGDTNSMAHSLELRVPMLDRNVLDLAFALPGNVRLPPGVPGKHLLKAAFPELLRPEVLEQKKRGFTLPVGKWLVSSMRELAEHSLLELESFGILEKEGIRAVWSAFLAEPESPMWSRVVTLVVLGNYLHRWGKVG